MAVNNKYAALGAQDSGLRLEKFDPFKFNNIGDKAQGKILEFSEPFDAPNKSYDPAKDPEYKKTYKCMVVNLEQPDGKKISLYISKPRMFDALSLALVEADLSDLVIGHEFVMAWTGLGEAPKGGGSRPFLFQAAIRKP